MDLVDRYVALWNEPDPDRRRAAIAGLWAEDGEQVLHPPAELRAGADALAMAASLDVRGHGELEARVTRAYDEFVAGGDHVFRARDAGVRLRDVVRVRWDMVGRDGAVAGGGEDLLVLDRRGRIRIDYQFVD